MSERDTTHDVEEKLLRGQALTLSDKVRAQRKQIEGLTEENRATAMEVDLYSAAVEALLRDNRKQRELAQVATMRAEVAEERARIADGHLARAVADIERLQIELLARPAPMRPS